MQPTRREFLGFGVAGLSFVSLGGIASRLFAEAAAASAAADKNDHCLIVIELNGGNDGLNTVVPFDNDLYYQNRRTLAIPKGDVLRLDDHLGLNPALAPLAEMFKQGQLAVLQGVGYPEPDRSHFRSMEIWHTASVNKLPPTAGWLGRFLDAAPPAADSLPGLALTSSLPQAMQTDRGVVPVISQLDALVDMGQGERQEATLLRNWIALGGGKNGSASFVRQQFQEMARTAERLQTAKAGYKSNVEYPQNDLGNQLKQAAQIVSGRLGVRVLFLSQGGYDTHAGQGQSHAQLLTELAASLAAFQKDLAGLQLADKVAVVTFSEFGRRVEENSSQGTDHGAASCMFVAGAQVQGGVYGQHPSLKKLDDGDLVFNTDFRQVYATLLDRWLGCAPDKILGQEFAALDLVKKSA